MQWNSTPNGGFTTGSATPWLAVNPNYTTINAEAEAKDPDSIYHYTQKAIALHHANLAFTYGDYKDLDPEHAQVFAYTRTLTMPRRPEQRFVVRLNWSEKPVE